MCNKPVHFNSPLPLVIEVTINVYCVDSIQCLNISLIVVSQCIKLVNNTKNKIYYYTFNVVYSLSLWKIYGLKNKLSKSIKSRMV